MNEWHKAEPQVLDCEREDPFSEEGHHRGRDTHAPGHAWLCQAMPVTACHASFRQFVRSVVRVLSYVIGQEAFIHRGHVDSPS